MTERGRASGLGTGEILEQPLSWLVRDATVEDLPATVGAMAQLLSELGGAVPADEALEAATAAVIEDPECGCVLVADTVENGLVGMLAGSWQHAIHVPGEYCILQDLWVHPAWRGRSVGASLIAGLAERMKSRRIARVEVGLPSEHFAGLQATLAFYERNGFEVLGPRMRRVLA